MHSDLCMSTVLLGVIIDSSEVILILVLSDNLHSRLQAHKTTRASAAIILQKSPLILMAFMRLIKLLSPMKLLFCHCV